MKCVNGNLHYNTCEIESGVSQLSVRGTSSESKQNLVYMFASVLYKFYHCAIYKEKAVVAWRTVAIAAIFIIRRKIIICRKIAARRRVWLLAANVALLTQKQLILAFVLASRSYFTSANKSVKVCKPYLLVPFKSIFVF